MESLTVATDLPRRRPSRTAPLSPSSAWSSVSNPFKSKAKLSSGVMSSWIEKQNETVFVQNRKIFYVPGLASIARSPEHAYTRPSTDKWEFKGIPVLTVNTHVPPTGSELDLRTEMDFWETVVPDKSPRPKEAETPTVTDQPEVLFDANEERKDESERTSDDGATYTDELQTISPRPLLPEIADTYAESTQNASQSGIVVQPRVTADSPLLRTQSG